MLEPSSGMNYMKLQGHNFHFNFSSTSPDKVWMWHEMRYGSRANWYLINARPDWRAQSHLLHVSSNMHDLQAGFLPQQTFHAIRSINVRWCTQPAHRGSKYSAATLCKSWQMLCGPCQHAVYLMHKIKHIWEHSMQWNVKGTVCSNIVLFDLSKSRRVVSNGFCNFIWKIYKQSKI